MYQEGLMRVIKTLDGIMPVMYLYELAFLTRRLCIYSPDEEDADAGVVLGSNHAKILIQAVELPIDDGISIEKVEKVHDPENRLNRCQHSHSCAIYKKTNHQVHVELLDESNLLWVRLGVGPKLVVMLHVGGLHDVFLKVYMINCRFILGIDSVGWLLGRHCDGSEKVAMGKMRVCPYPVDLTLI